MKTINDIAKAAGVSPASVSKALNGYKNVNEKTREKILRIAEMYDYFPNRSAVQLASKAEDTIGLIMPMVSYNASYEYLLGIISGVYNFAEAAGFRVAIFTSNTVENYNKSYVQFCHSNNLIGMVIHGLDNIDPQIMRLVESEIPSVFIDSDIEGKKTCVVSVNNELAGENVVDVLVGLGHRHIVFVAGPDYVSAAHGRLAGYRRAILKHNLEARVIPTRFFYQEAYDKSKDYILENPEATAFFCASDIMAVGALNACLDLKYRVPDDISIIGFDDLSITQYVRPQISTVRQDFYQMGRKSAELLLDIRNGVETPKRHYLDHELIFRQSAARNIRER
ncbi:MAG: LacI family transcriptional regulator [Clostridiales bacterium]|jgi:LacI family transcriptional regulator|nr:LacI family transcriptional regulator [Clostridiales bacterium]